MSSREVSPLGQDQPESVSYELTAEQKAALSLETRLCLTLATHADFQEAPHPAPDINELFAADIGIDLENEEEKKQLQHANREVKLKNLVQFEMVDGGIKPTLTAAGYSSLAREVAKVTVRSPATNGDGSTVD